MRLAKAIFGIGLALCLLASSAGATYSHLYVFGDSLSDTGNLRNLVLAATSGTTDPLPPPLLQRPFLERSSGRGISGSGIGPDR